MPDTDQAVVTVYPDQGTYDDWKNDARELGMSVSRYIQSMVKLGQQDIDPEININSSERDLQDKIRELETELKHARERIKRLERESEAALKTEILEFIKENEGTGFAPVCQHIENRASILVSEYIDELEGEFLYIENGELYYHKEGCQ